MKNTTSILFLAALLVAVLPAASGDSPATPALQGDPAHPSVARWLRSELYFGVGRAESAPGAEAGVTDADWRAFLDREVTPRFPDGLTVFDAYGQWLAKGRARPERLRTKVLVILHEDTPERRAAIDAIRLAWKTARHDQSVLLVTEPADVSF
jgi:hypothetical protein